MLSFRSALLTRLLCAFCFTSLAFHSQSALALEESFFGGAATRHTEPARPPAPVPPVAEPETPPPATNPREGLVLEIADDFAKFSTIDLTVKPNDVWDRMRRGFAMPDLGTDLVTERQLYFLNRPAYLKRVFERGRLYLFHIVEELEKRGMPTELALLPMVESAYNPTAVSPAGAVGLWQFIPSTGRNFQLGQNWWMDERRDIVASTTAALDYLQTIYEMHGDWHLALASYNWGEGAVARAIAKNQSAGLPTDYSSLSMPNETRQYVPKLQALKNIVMQPHLFGLQLPHVANQPYFGTVTAPADIDLEVAAQLAETPLEEIIALNPSYSRKRAAKDQQLVIPLEKLKVFQRNVAKHDKPFIRWQLYTLGRGETVETAASRFGVTAAAIRQANNIGPRSRLTPGRSLVIPSGEPPGEIELPPEPPPSREPAALGHGLRPVPLGMSAQTVSREKATGKNSKAESPKDKRGNAKEGNRPATKEKAGAKAPAKENKPAAPAKKGK